MTHTTAKRSSVAIPPHNELLRVAREHAYRLLESSNTDNHVTRILNGFLITLILLNTVAVMLATVTSLTRHWGVLLYMFEIASTTVFAIEYLLRLWVCVENVSFRQPILGRIRFIFTPMALIDLFAILPIFLPILLPFDLRFIRIVRLLRLARLLKLGRYSEGLQVLATVLKQKKEELAITLGLVLVLLTLASSAMYYIEHDANPRAFPNIPATMWWGIVTLTTIGYGDVYPVTIIGKCISGIVALLGIGMFALPAGILGSGFVEERARRQKTSKHHTYFDDLERLAELHAKGILTDEEFTAKKKQVLKI